MAVENRGGMRPSAPQNNPANVNALGGNGQSGNIDYTGFGYGMNQAINQQRQQAPISAPRPRATPPRITSGQPVIGLTEPTNYPDEPIGEVTSTNIFNMPNMSPEQVDKNFNASIQTYAPQFLYIASQPDTSQETRDTLAMLMRYSQS
jgi:hypothetical protein